LIRALEKDGWYVKRVKGSHHAMRHPTIRDTVVVPVHRNRPIPRGTLGNILRTARMSREELRELL
jgi:predicted RNA binding protein YcfA (HicA-like mRNA interferase family)